MSTTMRHIASTILATFLLGWSAQILADVRASKDGKCPSDYTSYTRKGGDLMCKKVEKEDKKKK
jgi:hypothetical protein